MEVRTATPGITFRLTPDSAAYWQEWTADRGAIIGGPTLFDFVDGWGGRHTMDVPVVVVTHRVPTKWVQNHPDAPFSEDVLLGDPETCGPSARVTHLRVPVLRPDPS